MPTTTRTKAAPIKNTATPATSPKKVSIADLDKGDIFSEISHYTYEGYDSVRKQHSFKHLESNETIYLTEKYVTNLLSSADWYDREIKVGREDKYWTPKLINEAIDSGELPSDTFIREDDVRVKGIRTLFEEIYNTEVFMVSFKKQDTAITKKDLAQAREAQILHAVSLIEKAKIAKKSITAAATEAMAWLQENPISTTKPGDSRILRGYKVQFTSRDGRYNCIDMDLPTNDNIRPVNINTLEWLVYKGVKYIVE